MSEEIAISVQGVSKAYRIWESPAGRLVSPFLQKAAGLFPSGSPLTRSLQNRAAKNYRDFWALKDISFEVKKGECVGIIGRNGSGKSTILQIIAGTLQPTSGTVKVNGRVAALLELGSGFNPEFTGRENVYLNAAVLGLSKHEVDAKFDAIAAFADIGDFIDQPVKTYSSGMSMRLAFAVQTAVSPDVLIVDEALSVGDAPFQAKCFERIQSLIKNGVAVLLVSHDLGAAKHFCTHSVWLHAGRVMRQGLTSEVCDAYQRDCLRSAGMGIEENIRSSISAPATSAHTEWENRVQFEENARLGRQGSGPIKITNFYISHQNGKRLTEARHDETLFACYELCSDREWNGLFQIGLTIKTIHGTEVLSIADRKHNLTLRTTPQKPERFVMRLNLPLRTGKYYATTSIFSFPPDGRFISGTYDYHRSTIMDRIQFAFFFEMLPQTHEGIYGPVHQEGVLQPYNANFTSPTLAI